MRPTSEQVAEELAQLAVYSESKIDAIVDSRLVGRGKETGSERIGLASDFKKRAVVSELTDRIWRRIRRD
jgi:hypothetical protein